MRAGSLCHQLEMSRPKPKRPHVLLSPGLADGWTSAKKREGDAVAPGIQMVQVRVRTRTFDNFSELHIFCRSVGHLHSRAKCHFLFCWGTPPPDPNKSAWRLPDRVAVPNLPTPAAGKLFRFLNIRLDERILVTTASTPSRR